MTVVDATEHFFSLSCSSDRSFIHSRNKKQILNLSVIKGDMSFQNIFEFPMMVLEEETQQKLEIFSKKGKSEIRNSRNQKS